MVASGSPAIPPIVDVEWLRERLSDDVVVCEVGSAMSQPDPEATYLSGHVPGARFVSLEVVLSSAPDGIEGRHPLPTPSGFAHHLGALGVGDETTVVAYDRHRGSFASRLVWMLRILGNDAALLDGVWSDPLEVGPTSFAATQRTVRDWPIAALANAQDVVEHVRAGGVVIDSRDRARYAGEVEPIDVVAGHIPGAINLPFGENLDAGGRFRAGEDLADRFAGVASDDDPIVYCGSGVTACHNALAMEHAGLALPRVYVASWSGWSADPDHEVGTGL
jgi:thiosulfate/3-mercaptopyruvate sulfurtransferase